MPGTYKYSMEIESNVKQLLSDMKEAQDRLDTLEGKEYKIKLNVDEKKLGNVISNLEKMLDSLGKGTGDFKQFENLSKELSSIVSEVQSLSKAFGKVDDSGTKTLLSSIQNIDKSLSELSQNILNVNKNMNNMGGNTSGAVKQVENISNAYQDAAKEAEKLADTQSKIGQKTNISLGDSKEQSTEIDLYHNLEKRKVTYDEIIDKIQTIISLKEKEKSLSKTSDDTKLYQKLYDENDINWAGDTEGTINRISDRLKEIYIKYNGKISLINENDIQEAAYLLDILKGAGESPNLNKSQEKFYQNKKFSNDSLFDNIHVDSQKTGEIDKINTELSETYRWFNQLEGVSLNENIANEIKSLISDMQIGGKNANEYANDLLKIFNIEVGSNSVVEQQNKLQSELKETESQAEKTTMAVKEVSSTASTEQKKDAFPSTEIKLDEAVISAKDLDKTLEQVDISTDSFDKVLEKLDRTKSELVDIVKITKQSVSDADGKFHDSYTLKDSRGSTEIYGVSSKTDKGQILRQNIVGYDVKKDTVDNSKELLAIEKQLQKEIEASDKANQKKFQDFQKEQANYEESVNKVNSTIQKTDEILDTLPLHDKLDGQFLDMIDSVDNLNSKLKSGELTLSEYKNEVKSVTSEYSKMVSIQQKRDVEEYNANAKANLENAKNIQAEWDKNIKAIQDYMDAVTKLNNLKAKDKGTGSEANQIELQTQNVEKLKQIAFEARQNLSSMQAENPDIIAWKQRVDTMELFNQASKGSAESAAKLKDVLNNIKVPSLDKYENKLSSYQTKKAGYDATIARFNDGGWTSNAYLENVQAVKNAVKEYEDLLKELKGKDASLVTNEDINKLNSYEKKIKDTIATVTNMSASEKGYNFVSGQKELDKIHKLLAENSKMSSEAKAKIRAYYAEIESGNPSMSLDRIHGEIMKIYNAEVEAGRAGRSFFDTLKNSGFHQIAAQMAGMFGIYDVINVVKEGINTVRELDTAMTEVRKVSDATEAQYASFQKTISSTAKEIASTNKELLNSSADFLRLGYSLDQTENLAKNATLFVNVGDGVDINEATEDMITAMKAFDIQAEDSIKIVDDYNQIGNKFALSATDIGEAMKRSASALETGNNSFEESIALITAMNEIVQNSENTGNTLKVFSLRLRGAKAELEAMSEDTDGLCESSSKLREQLQALTGVDIMVDDNTFKSTTQIVKELGAVWNKLSDSSQAATLELIAGKTRANNVAALLKNYQQIDNVLESLGEAEGSALRENDAIVDSINGRIKILSASAEEFWKTFIDTDLVKNTVSLLSDMLNILTQIIDKGGALGTLGIGGAGVGIGAFIKNFSWLTKSYKDSPKFLVG